MDGENVLDSLEKAENQSFCIVSGAVKTTQIDAMLMTGDSPLRNVSQKKTIILWEKIVRVPACFSLWNEVSRVFIRDLKTKMGFLQAVLQLKNSFGLNYEPEYLVPPQNRLNSKPGINLTCPKG